MTTTTIPAAGRRAGRLAAVAAMAAALGACSGLKAEDPVDRVFAPSGDVAVVEGLLVLPEGAEVPPTSRAEARLVDLDRTGTEGDFLVASTVTDAAGAPVPFRLQWRPGALPEGHRYVVTGRLIGRGGTLYTVEEPVAVAATPDRQDITLALVPTGTAPAAEDGASYSLEGIPDPSETEAMPMTSDGGGLGGVYDDRLGGDSLSDYISSDDYGGRVIAPAPTPTVE
ncbi:hypothetical protein C882_1919 [Caenispirillum salinarum AK4]|uniref:Lipoprotein n=1 Tax=Caenispirillum salinarum AK4 TaxID=1238182 RepID=K9GLV3_9PROT|nr:YbaY family lipoprotein [Caenispirillum salinarum]EKV26990.1 hypothetical protein C882_1919 [Caenispirillum salinarum AK4]